MKWLITIITAALTTTGCMLESPDPCENSPIGCDVAPYTAPPQKPSKPNVTPVSGTESITISYAASGADYYFVHSSDTLPVGTQYQIETTSSTHTFTGLDPNKEYYYTVTAVNDSGISPASATATSQPRTVATSPTVSPTTDTSNTVTWTAVNGADDYIVYMSKATPVTTSDTAVNAGTGTSYVHTGLNAGDTWYYMVTPRNEVGAVNSIEVSTEVLPQAPGTLVASPKSSGGGIQTQWTASTGHDGYRLLYRIGSHSLSDILASPSTINLSAGSTSKNITTVSINQLASIVLVAYNSAGESTYSNVVEEQPVPRTVQIQTPDVSRPGKVVLTWLDNNGVNSFKVYRMTGSSGNPETAGTLIDTLSGTVMTYTDTSFPTYGGTTYRYAVVPEGGGGVGVIDRENAVPVEPAWETIVYDGNDSFMEVQVAGSPTGEAYVLATSYDHNHLFKYNEVSELQYEVILTNGSNYPAGRAMALTFAPDGNLMALMRVYGSHVPSGLTSTGWYAYVLAKINPADGSYIWNKLINPFTNDQWNTTMSNRSENFSYGVLNGMLAEMVVDSTGASYVAWGSAGVSSYVKYDTNGDLVTTYDRVADTTGETLGEFASKPLVVVLPDDSFFWFQFVNKNSQDYLMGSKWASDGSVIFKNRTLDISHADGSVLPATSANPSSHERHTGTAVADAVGNIFLSVHTTVGNLLKFNSEGTFISGTDDGIDDYGDELTLATNGESIYAIGSGSYQNGYGKFVKYSNSLVKETMKASIGSQMKQDAYVDPTSCFVYVASVTRQDRAMNYYLGNPTSPSSTQFSNNTVNSGGARKFLLYRVNNDLTLNAATSSCPTPSSLPSATTPVSIAGNGSELGYIVHSGVNGFGDWRMKYSSASTPVEHTIAGVIDMSYGFDSQCVATATGVQCKGYQGGGLGDAANTTNTTSYVTVDTLTSALDVSVGKDFVCALNGSGKPYCWGSNVKGRLGTGNNNTYVTPEASNTSTTFVSIESGAKHSCALTAAGAMECWGSNEEGQMAETLWDSVNRTGTKSKKSPDTIGELIGSTISKVSIGAESLFTAALIDNGSIAVWGEYNGTVYTDHFVLNSGVATDVAAGRYHICYLESGAVTCTGNNSAGQTTVPTLTDPQSIFAGEDWSCAGSSNGSYTCWGSKAGW